MTPARRYWTYFYDHGLKRARVGYVTPAELPPGVPLRRRPPWRRRASRARLGDRNSGTPFLPFNPTPRPEIATMLFFTHPDKYGAPKDTAWHVGEPVPKLQGVTKVQADCDELELIRMLFSGIPMYTGPVVNWRGDTAVFIYDNLVNYGHKPRELRQ